MAKNPAQNFITQTPITAEAREAMIGSLFLDDLPNNGELFIPDDDFYVVLDSHARVRRMTDILCHWLGIKPGYIGLEFETGDSQPTDGRRYTIYLEASTLADEFVLGGFLAFTLTRYLLEERKQVFLPEPDRQAALLASASVLFGLSLVIMNGVNPNYGRLGSFRNRNSHLLKAFPVANYVAMTRNFLRQKRIDPNSYKHSLTPWTAGRLDLKMPKQTTHAVHVARQRIRINDLKLVGVIWIGLVIIGIGGFVLANRIKPATTRLRSAQQQAVLLKGLERVCADSLAYKRQYTDLGDIQAERALNAESLRCQSLRNQTNAAEQRIRQLSDQN